MDNKLSELSKPVATVDVQRGRPDGNMFGVAWSSAGHAMPDGPHFLYSQEYVSVLLAELEKAQRANNSAPAILRQLAEEKQKRGEVAAATAFNYAASALQKELSK
ncbi:MAG: hypothetical protein E7K92_02270 [Serratia marcescens]|nr:hypothetical protein [Serratia marcescens]